MQTDENVRVFAFSLNCQIQNPRCILDSPNGVDVQMASAYRLFREAHVIATKDGGKPDIVAIPPGSVIIVPESPAQAGLMPVQWKSITVKMFAEDLEHRAEPLD